MVKMLKMLWSVEISARFKLCQVKMGHMLLPVTTEL
jgi:hypothetical protein